MITKAAATQLSTSYIASLPGRINDALLANAQNGAIGGVFSYPPQTPQAQVNAYVVAAQAAGWGCVNDAVAFTVTFS